MQAIKRIILKNMNYREKRIGRSIKTRRSELGGLLKEQKQISSIRSTEDGSAAESKQICNRQQVNKTIIPVKITVVSRSRRVMKRVGFTK